MIEQIEKDVTLAEEFTTKYNLCESPNKILREIMAEVTNAALLIADIPPRDGFKQ